tara:strand:- start:2348 stop:2602 length:255 start_codon:yes stop_codon:yes gene_type:complete
VFFYSPKRVWSILFSGPTQEGIMQKNKKTTIILWLFGLHRFYLGKIGTGILYIFTGGGLIVWAIIDIINIMNGKMTDSNGNTLA